jgi:hypothetical protein
MKAILALFVAIAARPPAAGRKSDRGSSRATILTLLIGVASPF